jgi:hypothetical protein
MSPNHHQLIGSNQKQGLSHIPVINGVKNAIKKFHSQLLAVLSAIPFARYLLGNNSPVIVHTIGPHVVAYPRINKHANTFNTVPSVSMMRQRDLDNQSHHNDKRPE